MRTLHELFCRVLSGARFSLLVCGVGALAVGQPPFEIGPAIANKATRDSKIWRAVAAKGSELQPAARQPVLRLNVVPAQQVVAPVIVRRALRLFCDPLHSLCLRIARAPCSWLLEASWHDGPAFRCRRN